MTSNFPLDPTDHVQSTTENHLFLDQNHSNSGEGTTSSYSCQETTVIGVSGSVREENYDVIIGRNLLSQVPQLLSERTQKILVIVPRALQATGDQIRLALAEAGFNAVVAEIPDGEEAKHIQVAAFCWQVLGQNDFTRSDAIVSVGGGATTDVAGFVASTWLRGVSVIHMPTSVLGMVDAAVGGKTGINTAEGKNLVGTFYAPRAVLVDLDALDTLPELELINGLAEVIKCGFIEDPKILELIEREIDRVKADDQKPAYLDPHSELFSELVSRAIKVKSDIVSADFTEAAQREFLNYGHTLGHSIELVERYQFRHGAAVSIGMMFAAELARTVGKLDDHAVDRHRKILETVGLPTRYRNDRWQELLEGMKRDKKARGDLLRFVVLDDIGKPSILDVPDPSVLFITYQEVGRDNGSTTKVSL